jgi:hypothetical protein
MNRAALILLQAQTTEWELLIIEPFFQQKLNKIKTEKRGWNLVVLLESRW